MQDEAVSKVVVTGGRGFLGRYLVDALVARGDDVTVLDMQAGDESPPRERVRFVRGDLRDGAAVAAACAGAETVFHVASLVRTRTNKVEDVRAVNVDGTRNVLRACEGAGVP